MKFIKVKSNYLQMALDEINKFLKPENIKFITETVEQDTINYTIFYDDSNMGYYAIQYLEEKLEMISSKMRKGYKYE